MEDRYVPCTWIKFVRFHYDQYVFNVARRRVEPWYSIEVFQTDLELFDVFRKFFDNKKVLVIELGTLKRVLTSKNVKPFIKTTLYHLYYVKVLDMEVCSRICRDKLNKLLKNLYSTDKDYILIISPYSTYALFWVKPLTYNDLLNDALSLEDLLSLKDVHSALK